MSGDGARSGVPGGAELVAFLEAVLMDTDAERIAVARHRVASLLGDAALVDAAATIASFNAVVKLADGTGIPLEPAKEERTRDFRSQLDIESFRA